MAAFYENNTIITASTLLDSALPRPSMWQKLLSMPSSPVESTAFSWAYQTKLLWTRLHVRQLTSIASFRLASRKLTAFNHPLVCLLLLSASLLFYHLCWLVFVERTIQMWYTIIVCQLKKKPYLVRYISRYCTCCALLMVYWPFQCLCQY